MQRLQISDAVLHHVGLIRSTKWSSMQFYKLYVCLWIQSFFGENKNIPGDLFGSIKFHVLEIPNKQLRGKVTLIYLGPQSWWKNTSDPQRKWTNTCTFQFYNVHITWLHAVVLMGHRPILQRSTHGGKWLLCLCYHKKNVNVYLYTHLPLLAAFSHLRAALLRLLTFTW